MSRRNLSLLPILILFVYSASVARAEQWAEVRSAHLTVVTDAGERQGRRVLEQFERMRAVFQKLYPKSDVDPVQPIVVVAARNAQAFRRLEPADYLHKGQIKLGGYYVHNEAKNYIVVRLDAESRNPYATVYHEYTHLQFAGSAAWMPLWLREGLAEFMQNTEIESKEVLLAQPDMDDISFLQRNALIPLEVLFRVDGASPYYHEEKKGTIFYAESWALVHYLQVNDLKEHTDKLTTYMTLLSQHEDAVYAAKQAFGDLNPLEQELASYVHAHVYSEFVLADADVPIDESAYKVRTLTAAQADAVQADLLAAVGRRADAQALADAALKADPRNVQALETKGLLAEQSHRLDDARKWYGEAVKLNDKDYLAQYRYASLLLEDGAAAQSAAIEGGLRAAIRLNPRFSPACDRLAVMLMSEGRNQEEAHTLELQAAWNDPGNLTYQMNIAGSLALLRRYQEAMLVLQDALALARNPAEMGEIQDRIAVVAEAQVHADQQKPGDASAHGSEAIIVAPVQAVQHPTMPETGNKLTVNGVIRGVTCSFPSVIELRVQVTAAKVLKLYNNEMSKIDLSALGFTPKDSMNPCTDFEGMKARVQYMATTDKAMDGQVVTIVLEK